MKKKHPNPIACLTAAVLAAAALLSACSSSDSSLPEESPAATAPAADEQDKLRISELMIKNHATLQTPGGRFSDWVELENISGESLPLNGWRLSDKADDGGWALPDLSLAPGEFLLVFCGVGEADPLCADFSLSAGEELRLIAPSGETVDRVTCGDLKADHVMARDENSIFQDSRWATPGFPNTAEGYIAFSGQRQASGPIVINEVMTYNTSCPLQYGQEPCDWVELRNVSDTEQDLSEFWLSDEQDEWQLWQLPQVLLAPGETFLILCSGGENADTGGYNHASFSLNALDEQLYLCRGDGVLADFVYLHDIPIEGSMGRMDGEDGFFYFTVPSPGEGNQDGQRRVSQMPEAVTPDGSYDGVSSLRVELSAAGQIYYTTDGTVPTPDSTPYTGALTLDGTTILRAVAVEDNAVPSRVSTYSYMINEGHSLPVLSLVVDNLNSFDGMYNAGRKYLELPANLALYDGDSSFNQACCVSMKGWTSLSLPKKSMGVSFKNVYGGDLNCDVFENGITDYSSLSIRAGQDYTFSIFRNELFQALCLEMGDAALTQESKYCILYINGEYRGIYCLKEDFSRQYYASHTGVDPDSVTAIRTPAAMDSDFFRDVVQFCWKNDISLDENYQYLCDQVDVDSLIDWFLIESYSANTDIQGNVRLFRSPENGNKWSFALYDLDWAFYYAGCDFTVLLEEVGNAGNQMPSLVKTMLQHPDFRAKVLQRFAELNRTTLSNEHVLALIDQFQALLEPEAARDRERWDLDLGSWYARVDELRAFITDNDWEMHNIDQLCWLLKVTAAEREEYFGR